MRIVFDTNVLLSAFITRGLSSRVLDICVERHSLYISQFIIDEVCEKLKDKFNVSATNIKKVTSYLSSYFVAETPEGKLPTICRDSDDNNILLLADTVQADLIITGDRDLLVLKKHGSTLIITPREFMEKFYVSH